MLSSLLSFLNSKSNHKEVNPYGGRIAHFLQYLGHRREGEEGLFWTSIFCGVISLFLAILFVYLLVV